MLAVVLAGGSSRRFGSDKLAADLAGRSLLEHAVGGIPLAWPVTVVGPPRPLARPVSLIAESPPGSGPGAALVAGARAAIAAGAEVMVSLPGDAPDGGAAAVILVDALVERGALACVGQDAAGRDQPLQLAIRGPALYALADVQDSAGARARDLLAQLPDLQRVRLADTLVRDLDTLEQATAWLAQRGDR